MEEWPRPAGLGDRNSRKHDDVEAGITELRAMSSFWLKKKQCSPKQNAFENALSIEESKVLKFLISLPSFFCFSLPSPATQSSANPPQNKIFLQLFPALFSWPLCFHASSSTMIILIHITVKESPK